MGGVFKGRRTAAAVFKGTPGNSCVWSRSDYAFFQAFWHNCSNNTGLLTSMLFTNTPGKHGMSTRVLSQHVSTMCAVEEFNAVTTSGGGRHRQRR